MCRCERVREIVTAEIELIHRHIQAHQFYQHFSNTDDATKDFVDKYAWIMREAYCAICEARLECDAINDHAASLPDISDDELWKLIEQCEPNHDLTNITFSITKRHIKNHKWFHGISTYSQAVHDFLSRFGWIIRDLNHHNSIKNILNGGTNGLYNHKHTE